MVVFLEILEDTVGDVLRIIPFLFLTYLFMEWMEHQTGNKMEIFLENHRRLAPVAGALFGLVPECGFSSAASSLYTSRVISAGTLIAVYLSTSDEMLPLLISKQAPISMIASILAVKFISALVVGFIADRFCSHPHTDIEAFCEREDCDCEDSILTSALKHTVKIVIWLFVLTLIVNGIMDTFGTDAMTNLVSGHPTIAVLTSTLVGMIPSCASSILLTTLYVDGVISFAAVCAGLLANAGIGIMVLFRVNPNMKDNLKIVGWTWGASFVIGLLLEILL